MPAEVQNIVVPARNFQESVYFHRDLLDFSILAESDEFCFLDAGGVNIAIHPVSRDSKFVPIQDDRTHGSHGHARPAALW
jgi:hypothetical protein